MFSYFLPPISNTRPARCVTLKEVYEMIVSDKWAQTTRSLRSLGREVQPKFKYRQLAFVTFSGIFSLRHSDHLVRHSGLVCLDFDHVGNEACVRELQQRLIADPCLDVQLAFRSPSGDGLKVVVARKIAESGMELSQIIEVHNAHYREMSQYIYQQYNIKVDKTNDIARACFLCHDPKAYYNRVQITDNRLQMTDGKHVDVASVSSAGSMRSKTLETAIQRIEQRGIDVTAHYHDWYRIGMALASHYGEAGRDYYHRISRFYPHYTPQETNKQYDHCLRYNCNRIRIGTLFYLLK